MHSARSKWYFGLNIPNVFEVNWIRKFGTQQYYDEVLETDDDVIPTGQNQWDAVVSFMQMHWINDPLHFAKAVHAAMPARSPFLGVILGEDTLGELRWSLQCAESSILGGISPRVSPMIQGSRMAGLLQDAQFEAITVDTEKIRVGYPDIRTLMRDVQLMGESSCIAARQTYLRRDVIREAERIYKGKSNKDVIYIISRELCGGTRNHSDL